MPAAASVALALAITLSCVLAGSLAAEDAYSERDLPSPLENFEACGQTKRGYVCDPGNYMSESQSKSIIGYRNKQMNTKINIYIFKYIYICIYLFVLLPYMHIYLYIIIYLYIYISISIYL